MGFCLAPSRKSHHFSLTKFNFSQLHITYYLFFKASNSYSFFLQSIFLCVNRYIYFSCNILLLHRNQHILDYVINMLFLCNNFYLLHPTEDKQTNKQTKTHGNKETKMQVERIGSFILKIAFSLFLIDIFFSSSRCICHTALRLFLVLFSCNKICL